MKTLLCCLLLLTSTELNASKRDTKDGGLAKYLARLQVAQPAAPPLTLGSIWVDSGRMAALSADYKAMNVGDLLEIVVVQGVTSTNSNAVSTNRTLNTSSGISSLPGKIKVGGVASLLGLNSSEALAGKGAASTATNVTTNLSGRVVAVLASGNLVVEAERVIDMNHEKQTIVLRGVVRRGDIGPNNTVASDAVGDLELEIKGKGVVSDGVRPPRQWLRTILSFLDF
ncbi:MAG: flagellar basal body L-ring protein FlgH [Terriglobales bacterium]|jgi:flagellar L-ring protein precursor FlgH